MTTPEKNYHELDPALAVGTRHAGFTVVDAQPLPEISGAYYQLRHDASGARALWLACADNNKSFAIAFKTPPANSTGVFHILEHSVLCGSEHYPVKEPFVNLLKTSMQTFLNALTFPDKTMYPVASTNTQDLENLMGVYLDAVLHPAIYQRPRIFEQEGWHYEYDREAKALAYNGVVFNEMKGVYSDPSEVDFHEVMHDLFPNTAYGFESGGNPRDIPTLTYEDFINTHARHYNLANSYTILYGNMDIDRELAFVDERFQAAAKREVGDPNPLELQAPAAAPFRRYEMQTTPENASVSVAYVIGTAADRERVLATDILIDALCGSNEAPLKKRILEEGLGADVQCSPIDDLLQPIALFHLVNAKEGVAARFRELLEDTCRELAEQGIPRDRLRASIAQAEFNLREGDWGYPDGIALSMRSMTSWLYSDERPVDYIRYEDALAAIKAGLEDGYFERLLAELTFENDHSAFVELVPVEKGGDAVEEQEELAAALAGMTDDDLAHIDAEVAALRYEQEAPDSPEALATLPQLGIEDIGEMEPEPHNELVEAPLPCIAHEVDTHKVDYVYHYFDLMRVAFDELPYVGLLTHLLGNLDTTEHDAAELDTLIEENLGDLSFFTATNCTDADPNEVTSSLVVYASALADHVESLATLPSEVWGSTLFTDKDDIRKILDQVRNKMEMTFIGSGHTAALSRVGRQLTKAPIVASQLAGVEFYQFLRELLDNYDERIDGVCEKLAELCRRIFTSDEVLVSFIGPAEDRERFWAAGGTLGLAPAAGDGAAHRLDIPEPKLCREAYVIPSTVGFVSAGTRLLPQLADNIGAWKVATRAITFDRLWNEVRVKGGAYGVGFRHTNSGMLRFHSYRDPNIDATLARYGEVAAWLENLELDERELTGYVVSVVGSFDAPLKPREAARNQDEVRFAKRDAGYRKRVRDQIIGTTTEQIRSLAPALAHMDEERGICVFAGREAIEASSVKFDKVVDLLA